MGSRWRKLNEGPPIRWIELKHMKWFGIKLKWRMLKWHYGHYGGILKSRVEMNAISDNIEEKINKVINAVKMEKML